MRFLLGKGVQDTEQYVKLFQMAKIEEENASVST